MTTIVSQTEFVDALIHGHSNWLFTPIAVLQNEVCKALKLGAVRQELIMSVETASKNLRKHPEFSDIYHLFRVAQAADQACDTEIIESGPHACQLFVELDLLLWEVVVKRSRSDEAICTSIHRANSKRLRTSRRKSKNLGQFTFQV